jgi:N6-L-threonylcarbamoyladenine synthase
VAKMLGLGYPGGPKIQKAAELGNKKTVSFPVADLENPYNFSFSGLKTSVLRYIQKNFKDNIIPDVEKNNISACFQDAVIRAITRNAERALRNFEIKSISLVGGVAANQPLRDSLINLAAAHKMKIIIPDMQYCGDNAAMITFRGLKLFESGKRFDLSYNPFPGIPENHFS